MTKFNLKHQTVKETETLEGNIVVYTETFYETEKGPPKWQKTVKTSTVGNKTVVIESFYEPEE